jgi:ribosomal protein S18 acetylase RimI-like enzyme
VFCSEDAKPTEEFAVSVNIREMTITDYEQVYNLWGRSEGLKVDQADSMSCIDRFLKQNPGLSFVAVDDNKIVGAVLCGHDGRRGYIDQLAVDGEYRLQGIGKSLVARCLYNLIRNGITKWHLFVIEDNQGAIDFWKKLGWHERVEMVTMSQFHENR